MGFSSNSMSSKNSKVSGGISSMTPHHSATTRKSRPDSKTKSNSRISLSEVSIANRKFANRGSSWNSRELILWNRRLKLILSLRRVQMRWSRIEFCIWYSSTADGMMKRRGERGKKQPPLDDFSPYQQGHKINDEKRGRRSLSCYLSKK